MIQLKCDCCGRLFHRKEYAVKKAQKRNQTRFFCSRDCAKKVLGNKSINLYSDNRKDELSPYKWYIKNSKFRNKQFDLTPQYLKEVFEKQGGKCVYTKVPLTFRHYKEKNCNKIYTASLDRINSDEGYVRGNVQFVSIAMNLCKNTMSDKEAREFIQSILTNHSEDIVQ